MYHFSEPTENAIIVRGLSNKDRRSLLGPDGISRIPPRVDQATTYRIPGVVGVDVSSWLPEDAVALYMQNKDVTESVEEWLSQHFEDLNAARSISSRSLATVRIRRTRSV